MDGDVWEAVDVPLGEEGEHYVVSIKKGAQLVRTFRVDLTSAIYTQQQQFEDFGEVPTEFNFEVAQISATEGAGVPRNLVVSL